MKNLLLFFLLVTSTGFATAQQAHDLTISTYEKEIIQLLRKQRSLAVAQEKPTGLRQRVVAQTFSSDSTTFTYSGLRGSKFDFNGFLYETVLENAIEPNVFSLLADSVSSYSQDTLKYIDYAYYRPDNKTDSLFSIFDSDVYSIDSTKMINVYNGNGVAEFTYYFHYDPVTSDTNAIFRYNYDGSQRRLTDTVWGKESGVWFLGTVTQYHYHASGQADTITSWGNITGTLTMTGQRVYTYYPDGKLRTFLGTNYPASGFFSSQQDTFGYTPGIEYCTRSQTIRTYDFGSGPEVSYRRLERYPGVNGNPDSTKYLKKNSLNASWTLQSVYRYTYNTFDNPEEILIYNSSNTSGAPDSRYRFYYELYDDGLSVEELNTAPVINLFPNPCTNDLFISVATKAKSEKYKISILNSLGQEVLSSERETNGKSVLRVETSTLISGIYFVIIRNEMGRISCRKIVKS
jgi:hypothetical protein